MPTNLPARGGCAIGAAALALTLAGGASAQRVMPDFPTAHMSLGTHSAVTITFGHPDDHRWEGMLVGAVGLGVLGAYALHEFCVFSENRPSNNCTLPTIEGLLLGALVGGITGGLIGGLIPKAKRDP